MAALVSPSLYSPLEYFPASPSSRSQRPRIQRTSSCPSPSLAFVQSLASSCPPPSEIPIPRVLEDIPSSLAWESAINATSQALTNGYTWSQEVPLPLNSQRFLLQHPSPVSTFDSLSPIQGSEVVNSPSTTVVSTSGQWDIWEAFEQFEETENWVFPGTVSSTDALVAASIISEQSQLIEDAKTNSSPLSTALSMTEDQSPVVSVPDVPMSTGLPSKVEVTSNGSMKRPRKSKKSTGPDQRSWNTQSSQLKYNDGKIVGSVEVWQPSTKVRKPRTKKERESTALNRSIGACPEHKKSHKACDNILFPYLRCFTARDPIFGYQISGMRLFRNKPAVGHPLESKRAELFNLHDVDGSMQGAIPLRLELTQGLGENLTVYVTPFVPRSDDKLNHVWFDRGNKRMLTMPPFCLTYMGYVMSNIQDYINRTAGRYLERIIEKSGPVTRAILLRATELSKHPEFSLIRDVLNLISISRMIEQDWEIVGDNPLSISPVTEKESPWYNKRPIPPIMDTGLDQIVIQKFLIPLRNEILSRLQAQLERKDMGNAFEIILTVFILSTHTEWLLRHSRKNAQRYRAQHRYSSLELASEYFHAHNILLSHFHYFARPSSPTTSSTTSRWLPSAASLLPEEASFLANVLHLLSAPLTIAQPGAHSYETELYWSRQVFQRDWKPRSLKIEDCP